jgi:hypothetical protein
MAKLISNRWAGCWFFATVAVCQLLDWARRVVTPSYLPKGLDADVFYQWIYWPVALGEACVVGSIAFLGSYIGYRAAGRHSPLECHVSIIVAITYAAFLTIILSATRQYQLSIQQGLILFFAVWLVGPAAASFYVKRLRGRGTLES